MGAGVGDGKDRIDRAQLAGDSGGATMKGERRLAAGSPENFNILPADPGLNAGAQSFGCCFLRCEAGGKAFLRIALAAAI